jgi:protein arginine kinase activator
MVCLAHTLEVKMENICPITGKSCNLPKMIHVTKFENGLIQQLDMCHECGNKEIGSNPIKEEVWQTFINNLFHKLQIDQMFSEDKLENIKKNIVNKEDLNNFISLIMKNSIGDKTNPATSSDIKCECGTTIEIWGETGRLGCAKCYDTFRTLLVPLIYKVQAGAEKHLGKRPKNIKESAQSLEKQMAIAVKEERYEDAAKLRDRIRDLKSMT